MPSIFSLIDSPPYIDLPFNLIGWLGWFLLCVLLLWSMWALREPERKGSIWRWLVLALLAITVPLTTLYLGIGLPLEDGLPLPGLPVEDQIPVMMFFSALPWVLAAGILGSFQAVILAGVSGLLFSLWQTHNLFTPLEIGGLALLFSWAVRQRYRTPFFAFLRHPVGGALFVTVAYIPVYILVAFFATNGSLAVRMDYALTQTWPYMLGRSGELVFASLAGEIFYLAGVRFWGRREELIPSPAETSLQMRFFSGTAPMVALLVLTLLIGDWIVAGRAARQMIEDRLSSTARVAAESLPYFLESGQNLILNLADEQMIGLPPEEMTQTLAHRLRSVPYFRQLSLLDEQGQPLAGYPIGQIDQIRLTAEEKAGIQLALKGVLVQTYTLPPWPGESTAQVSFIAAVRNRQGEVRGVLLGRTDLNSNPFTQPAIQALETVREMGGEGQVLDENRRILYHSISGRVMNSYLGQLPSDAGFFDEVSPAGTRQLVYYHPVFGQQWAVVLIVPAENAQQLALDMAIPLLLLLIPLAVLALMGLRLGLNAITASLRSLAKEAGQIAQGQLDHPLKVEGMDEVGRFASAFEHMRSSLRDRLEELKRLLAVSQGVAGNLEAGDAMRHILQAALDEETCLARVVLVGDVSLDPHSIGPIAYGTGPAADVYAFLDRQIFELMRQQDVLAVSNTTRMRRLNIPAGSAQPGAILALALRHESAYYGALWIAYDEPHNFTEEGIRFLSTLAGQAALAAANARLYASAEIGRQRLEAVLASTNEPVLVIDEQMRLLLLNPAALQVPALVSSSIPGRHVKDVIAHPELLDLISMPVDERFSSREISLPNGRIYYASVSPVMAEGLMVGKVCILRDITHYVELDALKTEFVATVSHDLRSPLTLMRGYATMMQMVGELNDQQKGYVHKIISGVENMNRLVTNLLDLGRIEAGIGLKIEQVPAAEVIDKVFHAVQPQATQKNIQLIKELPLQKTVVIEADAALMQQALYNLVENAVKYTPVGGRVEVHLVVRSDTVVFEVRDTGIGIAPIDLPHMFEKFYRSGRRETAQVRGSGLGLAIVKSIADRHRGRVWVESKLGKGSTFYLETPFLQS